jgi:tRNA pseudouridine55 synthase
MRSFRQLDGILLLDKPIGISSNAALQRARKLFCAEKAGHAGSLDPLASGLLPVCFGQATKVCGWLLDSRKTYQVTAKLGTRTATGDAEGDVIEEKAIPALDGVDAVLARFLGEQLQVPPMYSALKHEGRRLYELARRGEVIDREPRRIVIERLELKHCGPAELELEVRCSKGTYVRTLVEDIAHALDTVGHVSVLRRLQLDPFEPERMFTFEQLESMNTDALDDLLLAPDVALAQMPRVELTDLQQTALLHGRVVAAATAEIGVARAYGPSGRFLGIVDVGPGAMAKPQRLFV